MTGFHVSRRFGWDCHGLPVEYEIDKKLGIKVGGCVVGVGRWVGGWVCVGGWVGGWLVRCVREGRLSC